MARCVAWLQGMRRMREHASTVRANNACRKGRALGRHERELKEKKKRTLFEMARPLRAARARRAPHFPSPRVALALTHGDCGGGYSSPVSLDLKSWTWSCPIAETTTTVTSLSAAMSALMRDFRAPARGARQRRDAGVTSTIYTWNKDRVSRLGDSGFGLYPPSPRSHAARHRSPWRAPAHARRRRWQTEASLATGVLCGCCVRRRWPGCAPWRLPSTMRRSSRTCPDPRV